MADFPFQDGTLRGQMSEKRTKPKFRVGQWAWCTICGMKVKLGTAASGEQTREVSFADTDPALEQFHDEPLAKAGETSGEWRFDVNQSAKDIVQDYESRCEAIDDPDPTWLEARIADVLRTAVQAGRAASGEQCKQRVRHEFVDGKCVRCKAPWSPSNSVHGPKASYCNEPRICPTCNRIEEYPGQVYWTAPAAAPELSADFFTQHETKYENRPSGAWLWHCSCGETDQPDSWEGCRVRTAQHWTDQINALLRKAGGK